ncbi:MAG: hypothetical protein JMN24_09275 [gamma proteobacterium endosymbiont of Lamellibrachia anaximandri]|nr:hypothetical protein [gamma proteobacterium endosymbiont of Lamellibrachia anaximandri]MBL3618224.1 hypothetical protein [gamma proteobacterium endosymbiont of Lamellibrachia anaximandri]
MKKIAFTAALLLSANLYAGGSSEFAYNGYDGNPDLFVGSSGSTSLPTAVQPGIGDAYGDVRLGGVNNSGHVGQRGSNEAYGSTILDQGHSIDW